jgi:hypothetical protein
MDAAADVVGGCQGLAVLLEAILRGVALQWLAGSENVDLESTIVTARRCCVRCSANPSRARRPRSRRSSPRRTPATTRFGARQ